MYCEKCGAVVDGYTNCPQCGAPVPVAQPYNAGNGQTLGSPVKVLVFGILSIALAGIVGLIFSIVTLSKASQYIATYGDIANQVRIGKRLAIVGLILSIAVIALYILLFALAAGGNQAVKTALGI